MIALELYQRTFRSIGICPDRSEKFLTLLRGLIGGFMYFNTFSLYLGSIFFVIKYAAVDLEMAFDAVVPAAAITANLFALTKAYLHQHKMSEIFNDFQHFYDMGKSVLIKIV